jgi:hypothetical protein
VQVEVTCIRRFSQGCRPQALAARRVVVGRGLRGLLIADEGAPGISQVHRIPGSAKVLFSRGCAGHAEVDQREQNGKRRNPTGRTVSRGWMVSHRGQKIKLTSIHSAVASLQRTHVLSGGLLLMQTKTSEVWRGQSSDTTHR